MTLSVICGLTDEASIFAPSQVQVVCGSRDRDLLDVMVPAGCTGLLSFGVAGALSPFLSVGDLVLGTRVLTDDNIYYCDIHWIQRVLERLDTDSTLSSIRQTIYSSNKETSDTPEQRAAIHSKNGAWAVDDESAVVAKFAAERKLPLMVIRAISDTADETIPMAARGATNPDGSSDIQAILTSLSRDLSQLGRLLQVAKDYEKALASLKTMYRLCQPTCYAP